MIEFLDIGMATRARPVKHLGSVAALETRLDLNQTWLIICHYSVEDALTGRRVELVASNFRVGSIDVRRTRLVAF
jgi:hypothetical protein